MSGIRDIADTLIAIAGDADAAMVLARELAADCAAVKHRREGAFWRSVAGALARPANPRLIIVRERGGGGAAHRIELGAKPLAKRAGLVHLKRQLRGAFERHRRKRVRAARTKPKLGAKA